VFNSKYHECMLSSPLNCSCFAACRKELHALLQEERLFGATLLILANKQDIPAALSLQEIEQVRAVEHRTAGALLDNGVLHVRAV
jgi:signal recognition particle receptor subunit beta